MLFLHQRVLPTFHVRRSSGLVKALGVLNCVWDAEKCQGFAGAKCHGP